MVLDQNNYAFIDGQNLNLGIQTLGWKLDYKKFRVYLAEKYSVTNAYIFLGYIKKNNALYEGLKRSGYIPIFRQISYASNRNVKGNVDAEMLLHTMIKLPTFDKAVIVSGDGDFFCLVEYLIGNSKLSRILIPNQNRYSSLYKNISTSITHVADFLGYYKNKLEYKAKSS